MNAPRPDAAHVAQQIRRDKLRDPAMFSSPSSSVAEFAAAEQIPLIAPSSSSSSSVILHPPPGCDWPAPPPPLAPYGHLYHQTPPADLHFAPAPLAWAVDAPGGGAGAGEMVFLPPEWSGGADAGAGAGDPRSARGLSLTLAFTSAAELCAVPYPTLLSDGGGSLQDVVGSTGEAAARRGAGPLGPFTGYAAILRSSRFLRPAQQLLDEFCGAVTGGKASKRGLVGEAIRGAASGCGYDVAGGEKESVSRGGNSGASTSSVYNSADLAGDQTGGGGGSKIHRPEFQQKKAKLLHMQEEVCRRYKQYHQQMQMVVSSFESVAGLNSATPYTSLALKSISKHFRNLKNAISDQIRHISKVLGEELLSSPSSSRGDATTSRLKYLDHSLRKQKACESTLSFMDNTQPVWRPQRGLPERAVSVLRAWLFEHFLHPYPTDSDKHMLATQTGLSRNQVSNWFINARVRLWKPMIEEIHMLETKGMSGMDLNSANVRDSRLVAGGGDDAARVANEPRMQLQQNAPIGYASMEPEFNDESSQNAESWQVDKRSRVEECEMLTNMGGGLMNFATYQHAMDIGGIEAVSLTLGLRHEGGQQNPQQMRHFGTQMFHDFVG